MSDADRILISGIECAVAIGVTAEERGVAQRLSIDVEMFTDAARPARSDSLADAIDYAQVAAAVAQVCHDRAYHLIETLAEQIAARVLSAFPIPRVRILVRKISPLARPRVNYVSIEIVRPG